MSSSSRKAVTIRRFSCWWIYDGEESQQGEQHSLFQLLRRAVAILTFLAAGYLYSAAK